MRRSRGEKASRDVAFGRQNCKAYKESHVSPRPVPRRTHLTWSSPREYENPEGTNRRIWLVGKQTTISNRNTLALISFLAESSPGFVPFHPAGSLPCLPAKAESLSGLRSASQTRSSLGRFANKPFCFYDLPVVVRSKVLTFAVSERCKVIDTGRSRRSGLRKSPNGPIAGLFLEILGKCDLIICKPRPKTGNLHIQRWSVFRPPDSAPSG